ncbi:hypothetical protein ACW185_04890 [Limosilactobacillus fermentum]
MQNQNARRSAPKQIQAGQAKYQELQAAVNEGRLNVNQTQTELVNKQAGPPNCRTWRVPKRWLKEEVEGVSDFASQQTKTRTRLSC